LRTFPAYSDRYSELFRGKGSDEQAFIKSVGDLLPGACSNPSFALSIAHRSPGRFAGLFWALLAGGLVENERCEFQHFGAFSAARVETRARSVDVSFKPSLRLRSGDAHEFIEFSEEDWFISKTSFEHIELVRADSIAVPQTAPVSQVRLLMLASEVLSRTIQSVLQSTLTDRACINAVQSGKSWFDILGMAIAIATHYSWILAFESELTNGHDVDVPGVGVFQSSHTEVRFDASSQFRSTLAANLRVFS
jgi:nucleoid DNA-binding protein